MIPDYKQKITVEHSGDDAESGARLKHLVETALPDTLIEVKGGRWKTSGIVMMPGVIIHAEADEWPCIQSDECGFVFKREAIEN